MGKKGRELLRGKPLSVDCYRATCSGVEYSKDGTDYYGCYGLMDWPENFNDECKACGAFVDNLSLAEEDNHDAGRGHRAR